MKKLTVIGIAIVMVLGISALSYADPMSTTKDIVLHLEVGGEFGFEVWDTELDQIIPSVIGGDTGFADIHIYATSNHSIQWTISAESAGLAGTTQPTPDTLPVKISTFDGAGAGLTGTLVDNLLLTGSPQAIYTAGAGEYPVRGLQVSALCIIPTLATTQEDGYEGIVQLTMTE